MLTRVINNTHNLICACMGTRVCNHKRNVTWPTYLLNIQRSTITVTTSDECTAIIGTTCVAALGIRLAWDHNRSNWASQLKHDQNYQKWHYPNACIFNATGTDGNTITAITSIVAWCHTEIDKIIQHSWVEWQHCDAEYEWCYTQAKECCNLQKIYRRHYLLTKQPIKIQKMYSETKALKIITMKVI